MPGFRRRIDKRRVSPGAGVADAADSTGRGVWTFRRRASRLVQSQAKACVCALLRDHDLALNRRVRNVMQDGWGIVGRVRAKPDTNTPSCEFAVRLMLCRRRFSRDGFGGDVRRTPDVSGVTGVLRRMLRKAGSRGVSTAEPARNAEIHRKRRWGDCAALRGCEAPHAVRTGGRSGLCREIDLLEGPAAPAVRRGGTLRMTIGPLVATTLRLL